MNVKSQALLMLGLVSALSVTTTAGALAKSPTAAITPDVTWTQPLVGTGIKTNDEYTDGNIFLTLPIWSTIGQNGKLGGNYLFIEPYTSVGDGGEVAASLGLSWRHLFSNESVSALNRKGSVGFMDEGWFLGGSLFMDMLDTAHNNSFWQLGVGLEAGTRFFEVRGNYYIPLTDQKLAQRNVSERSYSSSSTQYNTVTGGGATDPYATGNQILQGIDQTTFATTTTRTTTVRTITQIFEKGMEGWDIDAAVLVPWLDQWMDVKLIGGYFSFDNQPFGPQSFGTGNVQGWKAGIEVRPVPAIVLSGTWYEDKRLTGDNWTVGAQLQVPLDKTWKDAFKFRRRHLVEHLAEPVHRQNDAVKIGNKKEESSSSSTGLKRVTRVVSQQKGQIVLADDVIFVNNGGDVGNGIQAGNEVTGTGTAEAPKAVVQSGANIAQTNSNTTGRVWSVYTQGTAAGYTEDVSATVGSVNFIGSGQLIQGLGGKTFGKGVAPVVNGGFFADNIRYFGVNGYTINFGNSSGHAQDDAIHVHVADGGIVNLIGNTINEAFQDAIYVSAFTGTAESTITISGNTINAPGVHGIHLDTDVDAAVKLIVSNNTITDAGVSNGDDGIYIEAASTAPLTASFSNNTITGSGNDAVNIFAATDNTTFNLAFTGNKFLNNDGDGVDFDTDGSNVKWNFSFTGNTFSGNGDNNLDLELETAPGQVLVGNITGNAFTGATGASDNLSIWLDSGKGGPRSSFIGTISGNTFTDSGDNAIHIEADGVGPSPDNTLVNVTITGNDFHNALGNYIATHAYGTSDVTVTQTNNNFHSAVGDAIQAVGSDNAVLTFIATGNTVANQNQHGIHLVLEDAASGTATISGNTLTNTFNNAIFVENTGATAATLTAAINDNIINGAQRGIYVDTLNGRTTNLTATGNSVSNITSQGIILQNSIDPASTGSSTLHVIALDNNTVDTTTDAQSAGIISQTGKLSTTIFDSISGNVIKNIGGRGMSFLSQGAAGTTVTLTKVDNNTVTNTGAQGIYVDAEGVGQLTGSFTNNTLTNVKAAGIKLATNDTSGLGAATVTAIVDSNTITTVNNQFGSGIQVVANGSTSQVTLNSASGNTISGLPSDGVGIDIRGIDGTVLAKKTDNNTITNTATSGGGILFRTTGAGFINLTGGTVNNNSITGTKLFGIKFDSPNGFNPSGILNGAVSGNHITMSGSNGVGIHINSDSGGSVTSLNIKDNTIDGTGATGIGLVNALNGASEINAVVLDHNTISGYATGILLSEGVGDGFPSRVLNAVVKNNLITTAGTGRGIQTIYLTTTATSAINLQLTGNSVTGTGGTGYWLGGDVSSNLGTLNVTQFDSNTLGSGYTAAHGINIQGTTNASLTNINGTLTNTIAAPAGGFNRLNITTGAGTVTGTININGTSVNLNTTATVP